MKTLKQTLSLALLAGVFATSAHAHKFEAVNTVSNAQAQGVLAVGQAMNEEDDRYTAVASYKVSEIKPAQKAGESTEALYTRLLKAVLHRDHPITGDDGGYEFSRVTSVDSLEGYFMDESKHLDEMKNALNAAGKDSGLLVLSGTGAGNNTAAYIFAVINPATSEIVYFISSNFGSDN